MNYSAELKKFVTSQYVYSAIRITLATVLPCLVLAHFGILKEYFLFPLGTSFVALCDQPGPFIRRRNALTFAIFCFVFVALIASLVMNFKVLVLLEIIAFGMFFSLIGVYGQRLAAVGSLSLVVLAIFIDGHLTGGNILKSLMIFASGCIWFLLIFLVVTTIQPYKLAGQMIGENYLQLAEFLKIKANYYQKNPDFDRLTIQVIAKQVGIKNLQEETRETVFKTRTIVNESTTTSRLLMLMFLNSMDLHEKLMTSESDYQKLQQSFEDSMILVNIHDYLNLLADEITNIGISLQIGTRAKPIFDLELELKNLNAHYFELRNKQMSPDNFENFMVLRQILMRINEITKEINEIYKVFSQDVKLAKSLSTGLDLKKFMPNEEKLNIKVLKNNISLSSSQFRHAIRITTALLVGYIFSMFDLLGLGHTYWILITITAILKPAYSITKKRNLLRLYGTIAGAVIAYTILHFIHINAILFTILLLSMIMCFSFLKGRYFWAVLFMTIYVFLSFNFLNPGNVDVIFKDRILDTLIAGVIASAVSYVVLPVWEHTQNLDLMKKSAADNLIYFESVISKFLEGDFDIEDYKMKRKNAIISLANLSDNFQRMISEPKNQQKKLEVVHQFVATSHLITAYTASLSQYSKNDEKYPEIDAESWSRKIGAEMQQTSVLLNGNEIDEVLKMESRLEPEDSSIEDMLSKRKTEIGESDLVDRRDPDKISHLTELKNIHDILELIYDVAKEQKKVIEKYRSEENPIPPQS
ncbi:FUSC family protein [Chryseobacterium carnipullorum]|uniref:FUSC family protein n=1 Tax=Chryseobacterium carnipullorum TaxID=1124835 RepID=A0A376DS80_CHRCU|nr:FUSC family membrane protein [Chryseobacterium carnipullorum]AZA49173.1 FUSC family protein [Chryseobacterium carnipullorum]AZA64069.1 FUSC family protein [Chryseobacterium carnipullorum]STC93979.1 Inner membrane protein yccS [Chryseobacterium carnipullorum]HBV16567.1 FUSC family protein [Chryseobacterium carnipullorum]